MANTGDIVPRMYGSFRGVDFRGEEVNYTRSPDSLNMWRNYKKLSSISTRPVLKKLHSFDETIHSVTFYKGKTMVHSGKTLYSIEDNTTKKIGTTTNEGGIGFVFNDKFYIVGGGNYIEWDEKNFKDFSVVNTLTGYIPTTTIAKRSTDATIDGGKSFAEEADPEYAKGRKASGGTRYEDINMLSPFRYNTFCGDGQTTTFELDAGKIEKVEAVTVDGVAKNGGYTVDVDKGTVKFDVAPPAPSTVGQDNVKILFKKTVPNYFNAIANCTIVRIFDNRIFYSGNPDYPNFFWHCALNDATYISDLDYYKEGQDNGKIRDMVAGNNALWVFREPTDSGADVFYHTPYTDETYGKIYPSSHSNISLGCVGRAVNFNDDIVYFSRRGMEGISGDITTEQMVAHRSSLVDRKLVAEDNYSDMVLAEWQGYLLCFVPIGDNASAVYLADARAMWQNENHYEYEWYYWELPHKVTSAVAYEDKIYCATPDSILVLSDTNGMADCECYWITPKDKFDTPYKQKTTNKKGCVVEALGDFSILAKTDTDTEFDEIGVYSSTDHIVSRIKKKKFKDIQMKFYSQSGFSLESVTLEAIVGGYIKK